MTQMTSGGDTRTRWYILHFYNHLYHHPSAQMILRTSGGDTRTRWNIALILIFCIITHLADDLEDIWWRHEDKVIHCSYILTCIITILADDSEDIQWWHEDKVIYSSYTHLYHHPSGRWFRGHPVATRGQGDIYCSYIITCIVTLLADDSEDIRWRHEDKVI